MPGIQKVLGSTIGTFRASHERVLLGTLESHCWSVLERRINATSAHQVTRCEQPNNQEPHYKASKI